MRAAEPGKKIFLFGHSMGGAVVTLYTLTREPRPDGLITSAAALKTEESGAVTGPLKAIAAIAPRAALFALKNEDFSRDPKVVAGVSTDPLIYDGPAPAHTAVQLLGGIAEIREKESTLDVPLLSLHGTLDKVTPPSGSKDLVDAAKTRDKTLKSYDGLVHEPEKQQVMDDVGAWLDAHTAG